MDNSIDPDDGEYEGQSQESQESQEENELEQHGDDEDLFAEWGGAQRPIRYEVHNSQASILTITPGNTQSSRRISYPGRRTPALVHISQNHFSICGSLPFACSLEFTCNSGPNSKPVRANNAGIGEWRWRAAQQQTEYGHRA